MGQAVAIHSDTKSQNNWWFGKLEIHDIVYYLVTLFEIIQNFLSKMKGYKFLGGQANNFSREN